MATTTPQGILLSTRTVIVIDERDVRRLWTLGNYGCSTRATRFKPAFLEEPKNNRRYHNRRNKGQQRQQQQEEEERPVPQTLQLNLMEAYHLVARGEMEVVDGSTGRRFADLLELGSEFARRYAEDEIGFELRKDAYLAFRDARWYTKTGTQYGCDYVLYATDIDRCHSTYCVHLMKKNKKKRERPRCDKSLVDVLRLMRVAEQTRKRAVLWDAASGRGVQLRRYVLKQEQQTHNKRPNTKPVASSTTVQPPRS